MYKCPSNTKTYTQRTPPNQTPLSNPLTPKSSPSLSPGAKKSKEKIDKNDHSFISIQLSLFIEERSWSRNGIFKMCSVKHFKRKKEKKTLCVEGRDASRLSLKTRNVAVLKLNFPLPAF